MIRKIIPILLLISLVAAVALAETGVSVRGGNRDRAPVLAPQDFHLDRLAGKVVMMAFWRDRNCPLCGDYINWLNRMQGRYGDEGFLVVAVNEDRDSSSAADMLNSIHPRSQVILDPKEKMGASYQLEGLPSTYLYDRTLEMKYKFVSFAVDNTDTLEAAIVELLKQEYKE